MQNDHKNINVWQRTSLVLALLLMLVWTGAQAQARHSTAAKGCDALVVSCYSPFYRWSACVVKEVEKAVAEQKTDGRVERLYLPIVGVRNQEQFDSLCHILHSRLDEVNPRTVVLVGSNSALYAHHVDSVKPGIPMLLVAGDVYTGTETADDCGKVLWNSNRVPDMELHKRYNLTIRCMPIQLEKEMQLITRLIPNVQNIYTISGEDTFSRTKSHELRRLVERKYSRLKYHHVDAAVVTTDSLLRLVSSLDATRDVVIYSSWISYYMSYDETAVMNSAIYLMEASNAPVFVIRDNGWIDGGNRVVGGCVTDEEEFYEGMRDVVKRMLSGTPANEISCETTGKSMVKLNYARMREFGIPLNLVPRGAVLVDQPNSTWDKYGTFIIASFVIAVIVLLLLLLFYMRQSIKIKELQIRDLNMAHRFSNLVQSMPIVYFRGSIVKNQSGRIVDINLLYGNKNIDKMMGSNAPAHIKGASFFNSMPDSAPSIIDDLDQNVARSIYQFDIIINSRDEDYYAMYFTVDFPNVDVFAVNISDTMQYQSRLEYANVLLKFAKEKAETSERVKTEFIQNMSHEIRTPLNAICGFVDVLISDDANSLTQDERNEFAAIIRNNSQMLMTLVNDVLDLSDLNSGKTVVDNSWVSVVDLCHWVIRTVEMRLTPGVTMHFDSQVGNNFYIFSDPKRLQQVLMNFATNAIKHTKEGSITLEFNLCTDEEEPGWVEFACTDTGCGVPPEMAQTIFERFAKLDSFTQGTGLGLAICRSVATLLGGKVMLDSTYTNGARFVFRLKCEQEIKEFPPNA